MRVGVPPNAHRPARLILPPQLGLQPAGGRVRSQGGKGLGRKECEAAGLDSAQGVVEGRKAPASGQRGARRALMLATFPCSMLLTRSHPLRTNGQECLDPNSGIRAHPVGF